MTDKGEDKATNRNTSPLKEGEDFYYDNGFIVFTEAYHRKRGYCCGSNCRHCPYDHVNVIKPTRS